MPYLKIYGQYKHFYNNLPAAAGGILKIKLLTDDGNATNDNDYDSDAIYLTEEYSIVLAANGFLPDSDVPGQEDTLIWCNAGGSTNSIYQFTDPDGTVWKASIAYGDGSPKKITEIRAGGNAPSNPDPVLNLIESRAVRFDIAQNLTDPQKAQARANIGVDGGSGGGASLTQSQRRCFHFQGSVPYNAGYIGTNIYFGNFFAIGETLGSCFWEAWVIPEETAEYVFALAPGGSHPLLFGFGGGSVATGGLALSGNQYDGTSNTSYSSVDKVQPGDVHHIAVGFDDVGNNIYVYLDGILTNVVPFTGVRQVGGSSVADIGLYLGGSDHSNFVGYIIAARGFEGVIPFTGNVFPASFIPKRAFTTVESIGNVEYAACFLPNLETDGETIPDISDGYNGKRHSGIRGIGGGGGWSADVSKLPQRAVIDFVKPTTSKTPETIPVGAILFDDFSRDNQTFAFAGIQNSEYPYIGVARTGQAWQGVSGGAPAGQPDVGILEGAAVGLGDFNSQRARVAVASNDHTVSVRRRGVGGIIVTVRRIDANNYLSVSLSSSTVNFEKVLGGAYTYPAGGAISDPNWTNATITVNGNTITVVVGGSTIILTESDLLTSSFIGIGVSGISRLERILVTPLAPPDSTPPSDVTGLSATMVSDSAINLDWTDATDNIGVTGYVLQRDTDSGFASPTTINHNSTTSAYSVTGLASSTTYYFRVKAKDAQGNVSANWSASASATTDAGAGNPLNWESYAASNWTLNPDNSLEATASTFAAYQPYVISRFNNVGDYIDVQIIDSAGGYVSGFELLDASDDYIRVSKNGAVVSTLPDQYLAGFNDGDVVRIEKISVNQFSRSVNGGTPDTITKTLSGEVRMRTLGVLTVDGVKLANPVTNISF